MTLQSDISAPRERSLRRVRTSAEISPDERHEADMIELRCLMLCAAVLERVQGVLKKQFPFIRGTYCVSRSHSKITRP